MTNSSRVTDRRSLVEIFLVVMKKVIFHFGFSHSIIIDNGTNLSKGSMEEFCQQEHIRLDVSSVVDPQSNGQAERAN